MCFNDSTGARLPGQMGLLCFPGCRIIWYKQPFQRQKLGPWLSTPGRQQTKKSLCVLFWTLDWRLPVLSGLLLFILLHNCTRCPVTALAHHPYQSHHCTLPLRIRILMSRQWQMAEALCWMQLPFHVPNSMWRVHLLSMTYVCVGRVAFVCLFSARVEGFNFFFCASSMDRLGRSMVPYISS